MRKETADREKDILDAAIEVFSSKGFDGSTTSEIAREAGIAEGTIFRYFKTKKDILHRIITKSIETIGDKIIISPVEAIINENADKSEEEVLFLIMKDRINVFNKNFAVIRIVLSEFLIKEDLRNEWSEKVISRIALVVGNYFKRGIESGKFRDEDIYTIVRSMLGMTAAYIIQRNLFPGLFPLDDEDTEIRKIINIFLNGIKK